MESKYYYRLIKDDEELYCSTNIPLEPDKLIEALCMEDMGYTAEQITKEEYDMNADIDEDEIDG